MSSTAKVSISVPDEDLLRWAKQRSKHTGVSLSAVFTEAVRFERQMEARRQFLEEMGPEALPNPAEAAAIRAEWDNIRKAGGTAKKPARIRRSAASDTPARNGDKRAKSPPRRATAKR